MKNSKNITIISLGLFGLVILLLVSSTFFINICLNRQDKVEENRIKYKKLGECLADASDYLTNEVRMFAVTQDITHFYNYWNEAEVIMTRENVINELKDGNGPKREFELLRAAKYYSDMLMQREITSMQLVLRSIDVTENTYKEDEMLSKWIRDVLNYDVDLRYDELDSNLIEDESVMMLYDSTYQEYKDYIMGNIEEFQEKMNTRLDKSVNEAKQGTSGATVLQIFLFSVALCIIGGLLVLIHRFYVNPLKNYTQLIVQEKKGAKDIFHLNPEGANETVDLGNAFNNLSEAINNELNMRKIAEEKMRMEKEKAEKANMAKSNFIAQMSHELRTPLNAINGYLYLIEKTDITEEQKRYTNNISLASNNLLEMINNILDFSKMEADKLKLEYSEFDILNLLDEVQCVLENEAANKNLSFRIVTEDSVPNYLMGDVIRIKQVLINLLYNSIKFTEEGIVMLVIDCVKKEKDYCTLSFKVKDTGIGVEEDKQQSIFDIFTQSDDGISRKYGGTGLGLPICRQIIKLASDKKYDLHVESKIGEGSTFSFLMDFAIAKPLEKEIEKIAPEYHVTKNKTIMIVDDNNVNLIMEKEILSKLGFQVLTECDGRAAVERLQSEQVDLILLDICMPELDGYGVAKILRKSERHNNTPIIALTANVSKSVEESIKEAGMDAYLEKPINMDKLMTTLSDMFRKHYDCDNNNSDEEFTIFDTAKIEKIMSYDKDMIKELLKIFLDTHQKDDVTLRTLLNNKQMDEVLSVVHNLKGVSANLNLIWLKSACDDLKKSIENEKDVSQRVEDFYRIFKDTMKEVNAYFSSLAEEKGDLNYV